MGLLLKPIYVYYVGQATRIWNDREMDEFRLEREVSMWFVLRCDRLKCGEIRK